ncbi:MAG: AraC family transcriptional regulator [Lachnospiraceae bacterium]|nr:AraC family transcriptional regulator [Lachnospiraceae bacterium]
MGNEAKETIHFNTPSSIILNYEESPETYPLHWHNAAEFTVALKDGCKYRIGDTLYEIDKGDILLAWPQQIHGTVKIPKSSVLFIQFPSAILENNLDLVSISRFLYEYHHVSASREPALAKFICDKISEIQKIHNSADHFSETRCKLCIGEILLKIGEHVMAENKDITEMEDSARTGWRYIHSACNYIMENVANELTQTQVAEYVGLSTFYFSKLFKQYMHMTFPVYLSGLRVKSATSLLLDKSLTITDCAFMSGFQSTTTFNKVFKDITGYSPREYRKLYR